MRVLSVLVILCSALLYVGCEESSKEKAIALANDCKEETGASDDDIQDMIKHQPASTAEGKCLRACVMKKFEIMDADGKIIRDGAVNIAKIMSKGDEAKEQLATEIIDECIELEVPEDDCEAAELYSSCFTDKANEKGLKLHE